MQEQPYSIGRKGEKWDQSEKQQWRVQQTIKRSYQEDVVTLIEPLSTSFSLIQYGELNYDESSDTKSNYALYLLKSKDWSKEKKTVLITGGVHGYETSGVMGALRFAKNLSENQGDYQGYHHAFNFIIAPCVSPWGYETINRWNPLAIDPNRSFYQDSPAQESAALMHYLQAHELSFDVHVDLHETTDTDNSEFRPALAARDAIEQKNWNIPDGFYLVGDESKPQPAFQKMIIDSVEQVTHIAPADESGRLIGVELEQFGVINYAARTLGLCMGLTDADYVTTTEVYPDSPKVDDENCIVAQVAAVTGALDYVLSVAKR